MKPVQWIGLLVVVAGIVFGVTFAASSLPGRKSSGPKVAPQARLTFADPVTTFPTPPAEAKDLPAPAECEVGQPQAHDFWFKNENAQDLPLGLFDKTCQCTNVYVFVAPAEWKDVPEPAARDKAAKDVEAAVTPVDLKDREGGVVVPAGRVGLVRLTWKGERAGPKSLAATLWMGEKGPGPEQKFEVYTVFVGPLRAPAEVYAGDLTPEQLPKTVYVRCWSSTRAQFPLEVLPLHSPWKEESNPLQIGRPTPLTEEELAELRKDPKNGKVLAGYKTPVTLGKRSPDGKNAFDLGLFRQRVELKTEGSDHAPFVVPVAVAGSIQGDLAPVDANAIPVRFNPFDRTVEVSQSIQLESEAAVTGLELDRERTPAFLGVALPDAPKKIGDRKTWTVEVKWVPSSQAVGVFPRDEEGYRDSAVYIRPVYAKAEATPACLRIPVVGKADTR
jgi:hypothetical protein